jgi:hypothetical protein
VNHEQRLKLISRAWGRNQKGYCFFPWIDREAQRKAGRRRAGFHEGEAFYWPRDRAKILKHMAEHEDHDLYWCPSLFEYEYRREDVATDEHALWADLDEVDPRTLEEYPPTIAWETSPGRYQALWIIESGDIQGASWPGNENQRMTYYVGADLGGWDTVQLLRLPGWKNHKYDDKPRGKLLWHDQRTYLSDDFSDLPQVHGGAVPSDITSALEKEIDAVDRLAVIGRIQLKLNHKAREILGAKEAAGDRSDNLWYLTRCLADAGCSVSEIVAIVRDTVWNKFAGRGDETKRLILEATKAIDKRAPEVQEELEEEAERPSLIRMASAFEGIQPPEWLVEGTLTQGAVGFVAGQPKSYKSWAGLDLAISVATGADFLNYFKVRNPGPVLYIQEEDPIITLKQRATKIWEGKQVDRLKVTTDGVEWEPATKDLGRFDPDIALYVKQGVIISEESWQIWLDEVLTEGMNGKAYRLVVIDTLMRVAGAVDENRAVEMMTKVYRPLSTLNAKHGCAIQVINHMRKSNKNDNGERGGQLMLGSVANHAWSEDSIYLHHDPKKQGIVIDFESKTAPGARYQMGNLNNKVWEPAIQDITEGPDEPMLRTKTKGQPITEILLSTPKSVAVLAKAAGISYQSARQQLLRAETKGLATKTADNLWMLPS